MKRVSLILYFTPEWEEEWNGDLQFWDFEKQNKVVNTEGYIVDYARCNNVTYAVQTLVLLKYLRTYDVNLILNIKTKKYFNTIF